MTPVQERTRKRVPRSERRVPVVSIDVPRYIYEGLRPIAEREHRSISEQVKHLLDQAVKAASR